MNTTLAVVVSAIVILITALVVITIFGGGIGQVGSLTNAKSICETQARSSCLSTGQLPLTWDIPSVSIPATGGSSSLVACSDGSVKGSGKKCSDYGYPTPTSGGGATPPATTGTSVA